MSQTESEGGHESPIKTPKQLITVVVLAFVVPILIIVLLSQFFANIRSVDKDSPGMAYDAVAKRLKPVGELGFAEEGGGAAKAPRSGEDVYKTVCSACHASGAAGAPKFGDKGEWAARLKKGQKALLASVISGLKAMPPRGGGADASDLELERAVVFLANQSGAAFKEPAAPAPAKEAAAVAGKPDGKAIYDASCVACHGTGVAGAPKTGDKAAWAPRLKTGMDALYASALKGKGAMPIKGGNMALVDADIKAAVDYLAGQAK
jgi:cytochrome c5